LKKQADSKKSGVDQKKAAQKVLIYTCTVCKSQMQDIKTYRMHFDSKHLKNEVPAEIKDVVLLTFNYIFLLFINHNIWCFNIKRKLIIPVKVFSVIECFEFVIMMIKFS